MTKAMYTRHKKVKSNRTEFIVHVNAWRFAAPEYFLPMNEGTCIQGQPKTPKDEELLSATRFFHGSVTRIRFQLFKSQRLRKCSVSL